MKVVLSEQQMASEEEANCWLAGRGWALELGFPCQNMSGLLSVFAWTREHACST